MRGGPSPVAKKQTLDERRAEEKLHKIQNSKKRILILARYNFPFYQWLEPEHAKILFTAQENKGGFEQKHYDDVRYFAKFEKNGNVDLLAKELHDRYLFTHIVYQAEEDIIRAARLREFLNVPGQSLASALCYRDKVIMKQYLNAHIAPDVLEYFSAPICERVLDVTTIFKFIEQHQLPVVIKPTRGMGSMDTYLLHTQEDLQRMLTKGVEAYGDGPIDYEIEKFCFGEMYHIDGFVDEKGVCRAIWPSKYINTCSGFLESKFLGSYSLQKDNPLTPRLIKLVVEILKSLNQPQTGYSFHVEVFHTKEDKFVFCEAACRTGGAGVSPVFRELTDIDLNKAIVQAQVGDALSSPFAESWATQSAPEGCCGWIIVYPKVGTIESVPAECPIAQCLSYDPTPRRCFASREHCTDALASFIVKGTDEADLKASIEKSVDWFLSSLVWK